MRFIIGYKIQQTKCGASPQPSSWEHTHIAARMSNTHDLPTVHEYLSAAANTTASAQPAWFAAAQALSLPTVTYEATKKPSPVPGAAPVNVQIPCLLCNHRIGMGNIYAPAPANTNVGGQPQNQPKHRERNDMPHQHRKATVGHNPMRLTLCKAMNALGASYPAPKGSTFQHVNLERIAVWLLKRYPEIVENGLDSNHDQLKGSRLARDLKKWWNSEEVVTIRVRAEQAGLGTALDEYAAEL